VRLVTSGKCHMTIKEHLGPYQTCNAEERSEGASVADYPPKPTSSCPCARSHPLGSGVEPDRSKAVGDPEWFAGLVCPPALMRMARCLSRWLLAWEAS
jgi:hypothetical protein